MPSFFRLCSILRRRNCHLPSKQYETRDTQRHVVSIWTQGLQQSWQPHVHGRHRGHPNQQWSGTQYFSNYQSSDVIGRRGQAGIIVHQRNNNVFDATQAQGNGTSTKLHPHPNWQFDRTCATHQQNSAQGVENHGYAIPLVALLRCAGPVSILLETWNTEFGGLLDQASSCQPPKKNWPQILTSATTDPEYIKLSTPKNTATKSFVKYILKTPSFVEKLAAKIKNNCSQRCLIEQWQGCVRLTVSPSCQKDINSQVSCQKYIYLQTRPSLLVAIKCCKTQFPPKYIPFYYESQDNTMTINDTEARRGGNLPPSLYINDSRLTSWDIYPLDK